MKKDHGTSKAVSTKQKVSFFAIFDGHGGSTCAEFLRDHLHQFISASDSYPSNPELALKEGFTKAEDEFLKQNLHILKDRSGSCAIAILLVDDMCYVANVGDSRAIMSLKNG